MLFPNNIEDKLRFGKLRDAVSEHCLSEIGKERIRQMTFMSQYEDIKGETGRTAEMIAIRDSQDDFPAGELPDLRDPLKRIRVEGLYLDEEELLALRTALGLIDKTTAFFNAAQETEYPLLRQLTADLYPYPLIAESIDRVLDHHGIIKDNATPQLAEIRHEIKSQEVAAARRLNSILKQAQTEGLVEPDATIAIRDGMAVIPVPAANKRRLGGIVLDESSTGRTAFVQPAEVVAINSRLRELHSEERREIVRILKEISSNIRPYAPDIVTAVETLGTLDFLRAKSLYAKDVDATIPIVENRQGIYLAGARHPLLFTQLRQQGKKTTPLNIELEKPDGRILVISGPNAGGKSVCLQTVGLIQYMLQCGMPVTVSESSKMGVFKNLFIDIGDDQSIENDLSTYSSHLTAMKFFVRNADSSTLLLIDEFGTGTEPMLGGAIAESVLAELNRKEAFGVVTTHYTNLKHFASQTKGLANGAMLFDTHKIEPLFTLQIGQPGSSFAFEIARKIGLPESILQEAKEKMGQENADYDRNLRQIVRDKHYWEQKRQNVKENDKKLAETLQKYNDMLESIKAERKEILAKAKEQAKELLAEANRRIENTIREIRESQAEKEKTKNLRSELEDFKEQTEQTDVEAEASIDKKMEQIRQRQNRQRERAKDKEQQRLKEAQEKAEKEQTENRPLAVGDYVAIDGQQNRIGKIMAFKGNTAQVAIGNLSSLIKTERLSRANKTTAQRQETENRIRVNISNISQTVREKKLNFSTEIDVRGLRADDALLKVSQFVDEAIMCEASQLRILHGKGNGILRQLIRQYLHSLPFVASAEDEHVQFGGAGITVVTLDT